MIKNSTLLLLILGLNTLLVSCTNNVPYGNNRRVGKYYDIRGFKMYCEVYGNGQPLLLIHGNNGSISTFKRIIPYFTDKYKVIIADSRAQGRSEDMKDSLSFEMMADDYAALLDKMNIDSADVVGWSDGGINALLLAMRHPRKVKKLVASGANLWPDSTAIDPKVWELEKDKYDQLKHNIKRSPSEKEIWKFFILDWQQPHISLASLQNVKCPALIMGGDHDMIRRQHLELIYKNIPRANLWIMADAGHGTLFDHRRKFMYNINSFLTSDFSKNQAFNRIFP